MAEKELYKPEEFYIERPDCRLYCETRGRGPLLLLIHGVAADADYFKETAQILAEYYTVVTYDRRGYSRSTAAEDADYAMETQAEDAACIIRRMDAGSACVIASSAGSTIAAALGLAHPDLTRRLILHEPILLVDETTQAQWDALYAGICTSLQKGRVTGSVLAFVRAMGGNDPRAPERPMEAAAQDLKNMKIFTEKELEHFFALSRTFAGIPVPVTLLAGELDPDGLFHKAAESAAQKFGWPLYYVPGYHNLAQDLPREFAVQILGVLRMYGE